MMEITIICEVCKKPHTYQKKENAYCLKKFCPECRRKRDSESFARNYNYVKSGKSVGRPKFSFVVEETQEKYISSFAWDESLECGGIL